MAGYIFGGDTGLSYEEMVRQRERAQQMQQQAGQAEGPGAGFNVLANGFASHILNKRANAAEAKGREGADTAFQNATGGGVLAQLFQQNLAGQPQEQAQPSGVAGAFEGAAASSGQFPASLVQTESGGNWKALNKEGYGGRLQFGAARLADAARAGVIPQGMSGAQFSQLPPAQQQAVENWHFSDIDQQAQRMGLDRYIGQNVGGVNVTQDAIRGMAHLGGIGGAAKFLQSGGQYNPADSNGTSLRDYGQRHGGGQRGGQAAPQAASMGGTNIPAIMEALANPYLDEGKRSVLSILLQDSIQQRNAAQTREMQMQDPAYQMGLQKAELELDALRNPRAKPIEVNGQLIDPSTYQVLGDFRTPEKTPNQYTQLTPEEVEAAKLPPGAYQRGADGKISQIGGAGTNVTVNNGGEVGTIPQGFELITDKGTGARSMQAISGGPADRSRADAAKTNAAGVTGDVVTNAATRARDAAAQRNAGSFGQGLIANLPWTDAAEVQRQVDVLKANASITSIAQMREQSPTGAGMGAPSDAEQKLLQDKIGALDPSSPNFTRDLGDAYRTLMRTIHGPDAGDALFERSWGGQPTAADLSDDDLMKKYGG